MSEVRVGEPVVIGEVTIVPLERVSVYRDSGKNRLSVYISKEPVGVMISSPEGKWAVDIYGEQMPLEAYIQEIHGLREVWDSL